MVSLLSFAGMQMDMRTYMKEAEHEYEAFKQKKSIRLSILLGVCLMFSLVGCGKSFQKLDDEGVALSTCMAKPMEGETWEICKLGTNKNVVEIMC